ncbi:MAG: PP2C family protein-serine/threonine phosphatase [Nocardioides sp.]|uniref:PP2C family protein-serine/threonine phosphatase n=1 Tax=Nocardioides sp. TaxID=35761 RepID=UPI003D6A112D
MSSHAFAERMRSNAIRRRLRDPELRTVLWLGLVTIVLTIFAAAQTSWLQWVPVAVLTVPLLLGAVLLGPRTLSWFVVFVMVMIVVAASRLTLSDRDFAAIAVHFALGAIVLFVAMRRTYLGVGGLSDELMLLDLTHKLDQGAIPPMPTGWLADSAVLPAGGTRFAGDFVVAARADTRLEIVVVDVSGKGERVGTRALQLSGAFGGLLGAVPPAEFLPAANRYLLRQDWQEGFATAVYLSIDLSTGAYEIRTAGHPPALVRRASTGRWEEAASDGPVLGLIDDVDFGACDGVLGLGDMVMLYTDGVVEAPGVDLEHGIGNLVATADHLAVTGRGGGARRLLEGLSASSDDRALVAVGRR